MTAQYDIWLDTPDGDRLALLDTFLSLQYARVVNDVGKFMIKLPDTLDRRLIRPDAMLEIWRTEGGCQTLELLGLIRRLEYGEENGAAYSILEGYDGNGLLADRIVAYAAGSAQAVKSGAADDVMKAIVRENLGSSATDTDRILSALTVQPDFTLGPTVDKRFARKVVLEVLKTYAEAAYTLGTPVYFDMVPQITGDNRATWEFRTAINQPGSDRTYSAYYPTLFSQEWGNLESPLLVYDYFDEYSVVYVGGQGEEAKRRVVEVEDTSRTGLSPWGRREKFLDATNQKTTAQLTSVGQRALATGRTRARFSGVLLSTTQTMYGRDWRVGDLVTASYRDMQFDVLVNVIHIRVDRNGEILEARLEVIL